MKNRIYKEASQKSANLMKTFVLWVWVFDWIIIQRKHFEMNQWQQSPRKRKARLDITVYWGVTAWDTVFRFCCRGIRCFQWIWILFFCYNSCSGVSSIWLFFPAQGARWLLPLLFESWLRFDVLFLCLGIMSPSSESQDV
jgi:hypothetical protein